MIADAKSGLLKATAIKKRITKAFPLKTVSQNSKVQEYFDEAKFKLNVVFDVITALEPKQAFACAEYLLFRYDTILSRVDDAGGARHELFKKIMPLFEVCFKSLPWHDGEKVDYLMSLYNSDYSHFEFVDIPQRFIDESDQKLLQTFIKRLETHIKNHGLKVRKATGKLESTSRDMLFSIAQFYAAQNEIDTAITWLEQAADSVEGYVRLIELLLEFGKVERVNAYLDQANLLATTAYERRIVSMLEKRALA
jgi:tetratricopeptide (TPR) repeat protein